MLALKIAAFLLSLSLGIIASGLGRIEVREDSDAEPVAIDHKCHPRSDGVMDTQCIKKRHVDVYAIGSAACGLRTNPLEEDLPGDRAKEPKITTPLKITYKQKANYTIEARENGIQGTVALRVTFLASGGIGGITTIKGLPFGLTERAIEASRKMRFEPEKVAGRPRTTTRPVTFTFNIY